MITVILALAFLLLSGAQPQQQQDESRLSTYSPQRLSAFNATICFTLIVIDKQDCTSCDEFESKFQSQQREIESLQKQLNYWQNTTINILEKYPIDGDKYFTLHLLDASYNLFLGGESRSCAIENELSLMDLSQQMEEGFNQTQGKAIISNFFVSL